MADVERSGERLIGVLIIAVLNNGLNILGIFIIRMCKRKRCNFDRGIVYKDDKRGEYGMRTKRFVSVLAAAVMVFVTGCNAITIDLGAENHPRSGRKWKYRICPTFEQPISLVTLAKAKEKAKTEGGKSDRGRRR